MHGCNTHVRLPSCVTSPYPGGWTQALLLTGVRAVNVRPLRSVLPCTPFTRLSAHTHMHCVGDVNTRAHVTAESPAEYAHAPIRWVTPGGCRQVGDARRVPPGRSPKHPGGLRPVGPAQGSFAPQLLRGLRLRVPACPPDVQSNLPALGSAARVPSQSAFEQSPLRGSPASAPFPRPWGPPGCQASVNTFFHLDFAFHS